MAISWLKMHSQGSKPEQEISIIINCNLCDSCKFNELEVLRRFVNGLKLFLMKGEELIKNLKEHRHKTSVRERTGGSSVR
jgi:hypothetical protein